MEAVKDFQIITFYEFRAFTGERLIDLKAQLAGAMAAHEIKGTIILATEGINASVCGSRRSIQKFTAAAERILGTHLESKSSFHETRPFQKIDVKIKPEIVTLRKPVDITLGDGTHVSAEAWNEIISDPDVVILDTRNDYEFRSGTFKGAINPGTEKFSDLPKFVEENLDPEKQPKVAMFCTGGIRCEKFAPYMKQLGFEQVYQLDGGILRYLEQVPPDQSLWEGECFVFDDRISVDHDLKQGSAPDHSFGKGRRRSE